MGFAAGAECSVWDRKNRRHLKDASFQNRSGSVSQTTRLSNAKQSTLILSFQCQRR